MSRFPAALAISLSVLALVGVGFLLTNQGARVVSTPSSSDVVDLADRLEALESRVSELAVERPSARRPDRRERDALGTGVRDAGELAESDDSDEESTQPSEGDLLARLDTLETRLRGLEEDPIQRAFTYLSSADAELRRRGVHEIERLAKSDPEARAALVERLDDEDAEVRAAALDTLTDIGDDEAAVLAASLLDDESSKVRREAIQTLVRTDSKDSAADIARFLDDEDDKVRELAVDSMGKLGYGAAAGALLGALGDEDGDVRGEAISSLGEIGAKKALPRLRELYEEQNTEGGLQRGDHRVRLAQALKQLGDRSVLEVEIQRLGDIVLNGNNDRSRGGALRGLMWIGRGEPAAREVFQQAAESGSGWIRREARRALGEEDDRKGRRR